MAGKDDNAAAPAADDKQDASAQQPRGVHLSEEQSMAWGQGVHIEEKEAKTEANILRTEFETAARDEAAADEAEAEVAAEEEAPVETPAEEETVEEPVAQYVEDPGEFTPSDYSFDVTVISEDGKGKSVKITSIQQWEELLDSEPNLGGSLAVNKAFRQAQKMESGQERDYQQWEQQKQEYEQAVKDEEVREQRNNSIFNEIRYLTDKGDLPKLTQEETDKLNWDDPAVVKAHPNIAPHKELLAYMRKENASRVKAGLQPLTSALDAYNAMQLDTRRSADVQAKKQAGEARKAAGARVASGSTTPISSAQPKGIAVGRVGDISRLGQNWNV